MNTPPVNHRTALNLLHLLRRVEPTATVTGTKEVARIGDLVFTIELAQTVRHDEYDGVRLRTVNPATGELDSTLLRFGEFKVTTGTGKHPLETLTRYSVRDLTSGVSTAPLERAVRDHIAAFTGLNLPR